MFGKISGVVGSPTGPTIRFLSPDQHPKFDGQIGSAKTHGDEWLIGIGSSATPEQTLAAAGSLGRLIASEKLTEVYLPAGLSPEAVGLALKLLCWNPKILRGNGTPEPETEDLTVILPDQTALDAFLRGWQIGEGVNLSRTLSQTPPNIATPLWIAEQCKTMASMHGLECRVIQGTELETLDLTGIRVVGQASTNPPCLIRLAYTPASGNTENPLVLVGKTVCYDTGGLSLKPREGMVGMKHDKNGGCAVIGSMLAIASVLKPDFPVVALLCAAENSVSNNAYRPDDVLRFRNGITVEVTNTDAEGRLVLADGLCWAVTEEKAAAIVDIATLTGGVVTALGTVYAGAFSNHDGFLNNLGAASAKCGEKFWRLPLHEDYRKMMKSPVADIINSNANRQAHPVQGATFLSYFVPESTPWIHLDIAGVHNQKSSAGAFEEGPNGFGVRLLMHLCETWTPAK